MTADPSSTPPPDDDVEDIFASFSELQGERDVIHTPGLVRFNAVLTQAAAKEGQAISVMADQVFSSGVVLAEMVDLGQIPIAGRSILEFGSGAGLPSLLASTVAAGPPRSVLLTDYPAPEITGNLRANVDRNAPVARCSVDWRPFEWGTDVAPLLATLDDPTAGFDLIFTADLLWLTPNLPALVQSCAATLAKTADATAYVLAGDYTPPSSVDLFFSLAASAGLRADALDLTAPWSGGLVEGLVGPEDEVDDRAWRAALSRRKARVKGWSVRWTDEALKKT